MSVNGVPLPDSDNSPGPSPPDQLHTTTITVLSSSPNTRGHSEECIERGWQHIDASDGGVCDRIRVLDLERQMWRLEQSLIAKNDVITKLKAENGKLSSELLEVHLEKLQKSISEKDTAIAILEHTLHKMSSSLKRSWRSPNPHSLETEMAELKRLKEERYALTTQIKAKARERPDVFRKDSLETLDSLRARHHESSKKQVCDALRAMEMSTAQLKQYIDQLLALLLDRKPSLLEGLPRIQQESGLDIDLFTAASLSELLEELHDEEKRHDGLQAYVDLLLERITEHCPDLLTPSRKPDLLTS